MNDRYEAALGKDARASSVGLRIGYFPVAQLIAGSAGVPGATVLGAAIFGRKTTEAEAVTAATAAQSLGVPVVGVDMRVLGQRADAPTCRAEVWSVDGVLTSRGELYGVRHACSAEVMFGCIEIDETAGETTGEADAAARFAGVGSGAAPTPPIQAATVAVYDGIFRAIDTLGFPQLLRVWNYVPDITGVIGGVERYHSFNAGRQEAFLAHRRSISTGAPAASALGTGGKEIKVYFLAARRAPLAIENPRQVSAYHYPARYGPHSPTFSRAALARLGTRRMLFISGTASIVGHESRHVGDIGGQIDETLDNVVLLLKQASRTGPERASFDAPFLKVYLRNARDIDAARNAVEHRFGSGVSTLYLHADVCRSELLIEIEAVATEIARNE